MIHIVLHFVVPVLVARACYGRRWRSAALVLVATMVVDVDHVLADPIYDPERCSIGFHPLHGAPALLLYGALFALPWAWKSRWNAGRRGRALWVVHLIGLGLLIHMALDWTDCLL